MATDSRGVVQHAPLVVRTDEMLERQVEGLDQLRAAGEELLVVVVEVPEENPLGFRNLTRGLRFSASPLGEVEDCHDGDLLYETISPEKLPPGSLAGRVSTLAPSTAVIALVPPPAPVALGGAGDGEQAPTLVHLDPRDFLAEFPESSLERRGISHGVNEAANGDHPLASSEATRATATEKDLHGTGLSRAPQGPLRVAVLLDPPDNDVGGCDGGWGSQPPATFFPALELGLELAVGHFWPPFIYNFNILLYLSQ